MTKTRAKPKEPRSYHKGNVAEDLLAAAARLLKSERFEDISVRRLTREVGVTPANFYNHFPSLNYLLLTLAAKGFDDTRERTNRIMARIPKRDEAAKLAGVQFVEFAMDNKQLFRIMFGQIPDALSHDEFKRASDAAFSQLVRLVHGEDLYDTANFPLTYERAKTAYAYWAMVYGLARNVIEEQFQFATSSRAEVRRIVEQMLATFTDGTGHADFVR